MLRVGLTGGIACGKSRVRRRLAAAGLHTLDLDEIAHAVMAPGGAAHAEVVGAFGPHVVAADGTVDRRALGALVFADEGARGRLNAIVHPLVREEEARRAAALRGKPGALLVTDAALLVEAGVHLRFDRLVVVHCPPRLQLRRLMERDGIDERTARVRIDAQMPVDQKQRFAHVVVDASGRPEETDLQADALAADLRELATRPRTRELPLERALGALQQGPLHGPRGLSPLILLREIARVGGLEMPRIARLLRPPENGAWYQAVPSPKERPGPEALAVPLVIWSLARGGDGPFVAAAAASLARLTHGDGRPVAAACLAALALHHVARAGTVSDLAARTPDLEAEARRWAREPPPREVGDAIAAAARHPVDPDRARAEAAAGADLAGTLVGMAIGCPPSAASAEAVELLKDVRAASAAEAPWEPI